jgi:anti-sigma B factor antagonist
MTGSEHEPEGSPGRAGARSVVDLRAVPVVVLDDMAVTDGLSDLRWHLHDLVLGGARSIEVDLSRTSRISSNALAALLSAHRACRARGGAVVLVNPNRQVTDVMRRTGLWRVFRVERGDPADRSGRLAVADGALL